MYVKYIGPDAAELLPINDVGIFGSLTLTFDRSTYNDRGTVEEHFGLYLK